MRPVKSLLIALVLSNSIGCLSTPGIAEPSMFICTIVDGEILDCVHTFDDSLRKDISNIDAIGFQCVSPKDYAALKLHHEALHEKANKK